MHHQHPLENPSLTPFGFAFPESVKRLGFDPDPGYWVNSEEVIARMWEKKNRAKNSHPLPAQTILHKILPSQATSSRIIEGDFQFNGLPYLSRDIMLLSSAMQYFGTSNGYCFLVTDISRLGISEFHPEREFLIKFEKEKMWRKDPILPILTHTCTSACSVVRGLRGGCYYQGTTVLPRDRVVFNGLLRWLGRRDGRAFIQRYKTRIRTLNATAWEKKKVRYRQRLGINVS